MERRGIYRKGSQGHARNISSYRLARQSFRKWRYPLTAFLALVFVFGTAPVVGDEFQASLLTNGETAGLVRQNPEKARKVILNLLHEFVKDCERFKIATCSEVGRLLVSDIVNSGDRLSEVIPAVQDFEERFEEEVALKACKYDLGKLLLPAKSASRDIAKFFERYGEALDSGELNRNVAELGTSLQSLEHIVEFCASR